MKERLKGGTVLSDDEFLSDALKRDDGHALLERAISDLLSSAILDHRLALWLAMKLIEIQRYQHPKTALNAKKLFGITKLGAPKDRHGSARVSTSQMAALYSLLKRRYGKSSAAETDVAKACGLTNSESPTSLIAQANYSSTAFDALDDDLLLSIIGADLLASVPNK